MMKILLWLLIFWDERAWEQSMVILISLVIAAGIAAMFVFRWVNSSILTDSRLYAQENENKEEVRGECR